MTTKAKQNPYIIFAPFLVFYLLICAFFHKDKLQGDEGRYLEFAHNLLHGYYSPPSPRQSLWSGPGYPILLMPFVGLGLPLVVISMLNGVLHYLCVVLTFKTLRFFTVFKLSLGIALFWAFYYNAYLSLPYSLTESFSVFLVSLIAYSLVKGYVENKRKFLLLGGFAFGFLVLTKIIFGYVLLFSTAVLVLTWLLNRKQEAYRKLFLVLGMAFLTTAPYLIYTFHLTGRIFYWGNSGGMSLYWMSNPEEGEFGDWKNERLTNGYIYESPVLHPFDSVLKKNHQADYAYILSFNGFERDDAFRRLAIRNIKAHPGKYLSNCVQNVGRMLFDLPYSYMPYTRITVLKIFMPAIVLSFLIPCIFLSLLNWRRIAFPIRALVTMTFIYLGASVLVSAYARQFMIIIPVLLVWMGYIFQKTIKLNPTLEKTSAE